VTTVIKAEGLSKRYVIGHAHQGRYLTFRETLIHSLRSASRRLLHPFLSSSGQPLTGLATTEELWAIKDVSFEIRHGDRVGIIGRNGAGKTTLLKILSRITEPTEGKVSINGRVASLLEVGTGFHPELTGRENIFLNGAVLGMNRAEIKGKFDQIVAFAEVEKFLDTPVKRYSSGMYVRLAFSVAAHLEPEILVVDEVLAVGDLQFQKKCIDKMENAATEGKTILLVSHNMASILSISTKSMLMADGKLIEMGASQDVVRRYQTSFVSKALGQTDLSTVERYGSGKAQFCSIVLKALNHHGEALPFPETGCDIVLEMHIKAKEEINHVVVAVTVYDEVGNRLIDVNTLIKGEALSLRSGQKAVTAFFLRNVRLKPDIYTVGLWLGIINLEDIDGIRYATSFRMEARKEDILYTRPFPGVYACEFDYTVEEIR
jgi:ABC-type polysaccharide/polyol phosphate transport system ATPase subunit